MKRQEYTLQEDLELLRQMRRCGHLLHHCYNLNGAQRRILLTLRGEPMTQKALTEHLRIQPGSLSETLTKVERAGLVEKRRSDKDKRGFELKLTQEGEKQALAFEQEQLKQAGELLSPLTARQKDTLHRLLDKLLGEWERPAEGDAGETNAK